MEMTAPGGLDPRELGKRLRAELRISGNMTVQSLQTELRERLGGARHTSYGSVWAYVNGRAPEKYNPQVLEAMARILQVRPGYLLHGGGRTEEEHEAQRTAERLASGAAVLGETADSEEAQNGRDQELDRALRSTFSDIPLSNLAKAALLRARGLVNAHPTIAVRATQPMSIPAFAVALMAPFRATSEEYGKPSSETLEAYIIEAAPAVARALREAWVERLTRLEREQSRRGK